MLISFKDIPSLPGPLGQVVDGTQNANSHNGGRSALEEDKVKDLIRFLGQTLLCFYPAATTAVNPSSDPLHGLICDESDELSECGTCCNSLNVTSCHVMLKLGDVADGAATDSNSWDSCAHCANCWYTHRKPAIGLPGQREIRDILEKVDHEKNVTVLNKYFISLSTVVAEFGSETRKRKGKKKGKIKRKTKLSVVKNLLSMTSSLKQKYNTFDLPVDRDKISKWIRDVLMTSTINFVDSDPKTNRCDTSTVWSLLKQCSTETTHNAIVNFENWFKASFHVPASSLVGLAAIFTAMKLTSVSLEMTEVTNAYSKLKSVTQHLTERLKDYLTRYDEVVTTLEGTIKRKLDAELIAQFFAIGIHAKLQDEFRQMYHSRNYGRRYTMSEIRKLVSAIPDKKPGTNNVDTGARNGVKKLAQVYDRLAATLSNVENGNGGSHSGESDGLNAFSGSHRKLICCKCGGDHPWFKCQAINGMLRFNKGARKFEWCNVGLRSDTDEGRAIAAKGGLKKAYMFNEGKTGQYFMRDGFEQTAEGKRIIETVAYLGSSKKVKHKLSKPQLNGEKLNRLELAAMMNSLGTKSETIPNASIASFEQGSAPGKKRKKKVTFGKNTDDENSNLSVASDSKKPKTLSARIDDMFAAISDVGSANPSMTVSEEGKRVRRDTLRALQADLDNRDADLTSDAPVEPSPSMSPSPSQSSPSVPAAVQATAHAPLEHPLSNPPCSQSITSANVPETLLDPDCTDSIGSDQVLDTIYKMPVPDLAQIQRKYQHLSLPAQQERMQQASREWWYSACNGNALQAMLQASFDRDGSPQPTPFCCKQLSTAEVGRLLRATFNLNHDQQFLLPYNQEIAPGYVHNKAMLTWMGMNPFDSGNCLDPDNMPHDSQQILCKSESKAYLGVGEFMGSLDTSAFTHKHASAQDSRLYEILRHHQPQGYRSANCPSHPDDVDPDCQTCKLRTCPLHGQQHCRLCSSTVQTACESIKLQDREHFERWCKLHVQRSQLLQSSMYDSTKKAGLVDIDNGVFGPIHESYCKLHWQFDNLPMLNASTHNLANHRQGGASTRRLRDNSKRYAGPLLNAYVARNGPSTPLPRWPRHPSEGGDVNHAFDVDECQRRMQMRYLADWRSSGYFLLSTSRVSFDVIPQPSHLDYQAPSPDFTWYHDHMVAARALSSASAVDPSPAYSSDASDEFPPCPEHSASTTPDPEPGMCDNSTQTSPVDPALAVVNDSIDHAKPLDAPALAGLMFGSIPAWTGASSAAALAAVPARIVNFCFNTLDGGQHDVQVDHSATVWSMSARIAEVTGIDRYHQQWIIDGAERNFSSTDSISNVIGKSVTILHNTCKVSWTSPQLSPPPCPPPPLPPCSPQSPPVHPQASPDKRRKGNEGIRVSTDDDHCSLMLELPPQVGGVAQVSTSQPLDTQQPPQSPRQSLLSDVELFCQSKARLSMQDRIQDAFGSSIATDETPPADHQCAFLEADQMVIAAATSCKSETMSFSNCEPSIGLNGSSHRSMTLLAELKKPTDKGNYLAYQETLDTGAGLDYMVMEVMEALIKFCPSVIVEKKRYAVPLTTIAADDGQMQRVGFIKVKVIIRNDKGQDVEVHRRYEILTKCILIAIRGIQGQSEDQGFLNVHNQDSSATMKPETYCVRDPATNVFPIVRANNHLEPSF